MGPGAGGRPSGRMSPGIRLRRMPPPLFRPEGLPSAPGRRIAGLPESRILGESDFRLSPLDRRASRKVGVSALGCEIKEEVSAEGRYRGTFASKRSEEHTSELQSLMRISYAVFCLKKKNTPH